MRRDEIETSIANFLNGSDVEDVDAVLADFMDNVIDANDENMTDQERARIEAAAREVLEDCANPTGLFERLSAEPATFLSEPPAGAVGYRAVAAIQGNVTVGWPGDFFENADVLFSTVFETPGQAMGAVERAYLGTDEFGVGAVWWVEPVTEEPEMPKAPTR